MSKTSSSKNSWTSTLLLSLLLIVCTGLISFTLHLLSERLSQQTLIYQKHDQQLAHVFRKLDVMRMQLVTQEKLLSKHNKDTQAGIRRLEEKISVLEETTAKLKHQIENADRTQLIINDGRARVNVSPYPNEETSFVGIGIQFQKIEEGLKVERVLEASPAKKVGLYAGDIITEIEGKPISKMTKTEAIEGLRGTEGSKVKITIKPAGTLNKTNVYELTRETINIAREKAD